MTRLNFFKTMFVAAAAIGGVFASNVKPATAQGGGVINIAITPSNIGFGQTAVYNTNSSFVGRPVSNGTLVFWYSGKHHLESYNWTVRLNRAGAASFIRAIPRDWVTQNTWVNLNAYCVETGVSTYWRIKN